MRTPKRMIVNPTEVRKINYDSRRFREDLQRVEDINEKHLEYKTPDKERMYLSYDI
jgi:hypothetical protein